MRNKLNVTENNLSDRIFYLDEIVRDKIKIHLLLVLMSVRIVSIE